MIIQIKLILRIVTVFLLWIHKVSEYLKQILGNKKEKIYFGCFSKLFLTLTATSLTGIKSLSWWYL